jgi:hypothetical protein
MDQLTDILNVVRVNKDLAALPALQADMRLREDLGFDSLDLAELTARIDGRGRAACVTGQVKTSHYGPGQNQPPRGWQW